MKFSRTLQLAVGSAAIVWVMVIYFFQGPLLPALVGALGAILWIVGKAWRGRPRVMHQLGTKDKGGSGEF